MLKAVVFDFDGTLVDTFAHDNFKKVAAEFGFKIGNDIDLKKYWGMTGMQIISKLCPNIDTENFQKRWTEIDVETLTLVDGALETLNFISCLKARKIKCGILSQRKMSGLLPVIKRLDIEKFFHPDLIQTTCLWPHAKPAPKTFDYMLEKSALLSIGREEILYVGDTLEDMYAANHADVKFAGVETGPVDKSTWLENGLAESNILKSVADLPGWLVEILTCN